MSQPALSSHGLGLAIKGFVRTLMVDICADRVTHAEVVAGGAFHFRRLFGKDMGPLFKHHRAPCDHLANVTFHFFVQTWDRRYLQQGSPQYDGLTAQRFLDAICPISAPTEAEIEDAWELEIGSSDSALRRFYEGSARVRRGKDLGARTSPLTVN